MAGDNSDSRYGMDKKRRRLMQSIGFASMPMIAGCLGGDDEGTPTPTEGNGTGNGDGNGDTPTEGNGNGDTPTDTDTPTEGNGDDTATPEPTMERYDETLHFFRGPPVPADAQFNRWNTNKPGWTVGGKIRTNFFNRSEFDYKVYGGLAKDWEYRPGVLEFELHDDFYFWDGSPVDADAVMTWYNFQNYHSGGDEFNARPNIVSLDKTGEYSVRASLADAWHEDWAIEQTFLNDGVEASKPWLDQWIQQYEDASSMDTVNEIRDEINNLVVTNPNPFQYAPFKINDAGENYWDLTLRTEDSDVLEAPEEPHYVDEINWTGARFWAVDDWGTRRTESFIQGKKYFGPTSAISEVDFATTSVEIRVDTGALGFNFNLASPPSNNPHFRRAWNYLNNRENWMMEEGVEFREGTTPFIYDSREERWISDDVRSDFTSYNPREADFASAEEEMLRGGFEQDSDGNWLFQEGDRAGEPMEWEIWMYTWHDEWENQGQQFLSDLEEFGINCSYRLDNGLWSRQRGGDFVVDTSYIGGALPTFVFGNTFDNVAMSGAGHPNPPDNMDAPPIGQQWTDNTELETFETRSMTQRMAVTVDETRRQSLIDQLGWVSNQTVPRAPIVGSIGGVALNTEKWDYRPIDEYPEKYAYKFNWDNWLQACMKYLPEGERPGTGPFGG